MVKIIKVKNNKEKGNTYKNMFARFKKAIKNEFYFEAIFIDYAMLEDRLTSFLKYLGIVIPSIDRLRINDNYYNSINNLFNDYNNSKLEINNISVKINLIKYLIKSYKLNSLEKYNLNNLRPVIESININTLETTLNELEGWIIKRNNLIHDLMEKEISSINDNLSDVAESGNLYVRSIDTQVSKIKEYIRKTYKKK
jgi:hypothetical protein